jgi:hypothetical protein
MRRGGYIMMNAMNKQNEYDLCLTILNQQLEALTKIAAAQTLVRDAVKRKQWIDFNMLIESMNSFSFQIEDLEQQRLAIFEDAADNDFAVCRRGGAPTFYAFAMRFPDTERNSLTNVYRRLKMETAKVRFTSDALNAYLTDARILVSGMIDEAYPERRGKIYSKKGSLRSADMRSLVINAQL